MDTEIRRPHPIINNPLSEVPFLKEITFVFLMCWMNSRRINHFTHKFSLSETFVYQQVILLMHSSMTSLTWSLEYFKTSSQCCWIIGVPCDFRGEMVVTMMHTNWINLFFVTFNTMWGSYIISKQPSLTWLRIAFNWIDNTTTQNGRAHHFQVSVECVLHRCIVLLWGRVVDLRIHIWYFSN